MYIYMYIYIYFVYEACERGILFSRFVGCGKFFDKRCM
jgi:hypothetical protein